jgi:hypothetical protein
MDEPPPAAALVPAIYDRMGHPLYRDAPDLDRDQGLVEEGRGRSERRTRPLAHRDQVW